MFKKPLVAAVAAAVAVGAFGIPAGAASTSAQEETGRIVLPVPHPQDPAICFQGVERRFNMATQGYGPTGVFGFVFDIDKATWKGKFALTSTGSDADLDIYFFQDFGDPVADPSMNSPVILTQYQERNTKGEVGTVPPTAVKAIVCMWEGFNGEFEYKASPPKKKKKKK